MIDRYTDPLIEDIFSQQRVIERWREAGLRSLIGLVNVGLAPQEAVDAAAAAGTPTPAEVREREQVTGHDVVAFLHEWDAKVDNEEFSRWVHRGLTSSDLVDNAHFEALFLTTQLYLSKIGRFSMALTSAATTHSKTYMLGRTHGQVAEPTTWGHRLYVFNSVLGRAQANMRRTRDAMMVRKVPGAVGTSSLYTGQVDPWQIPSTQVIPRDIQVAWAMACVQVVNACEAVALEIRLLSHHGVAEVREGANRVGSSAMPHKHNPIGAENICGLARVARATLFPIMETQQLWHDRDISNSAIERTMVPDLAHLTATILTRTTALVSNLEVDVQQMDWNLGNAGYEPYSSLWVSLLQPEIGYYDAHEMVQEAFRAKDPLVAILDAMDAQNLDTITFNAKIQGRMSAEWMTRNIRPAR